MASNSVKKLRVVLCAAAFVAFAEGVTAKKPAPPPSPLRVEPVIDVSQFVGVPSCAFALNELGTVVGLHRVYGSLRGFSWSSAGTVDLGVDTIALAINDHGEIAGYDHVTGSGLGATLWTHDERVNVAYGRAYSLNNRTEVVGFHVPENSIYHAFRWTPAGGLEDVESLTGEVPPWSYFTPFSEARFIRNDGVMAGWRDGLATIWQPNGEFSTLGTGVATSVNDWEVAAGATSLSNGHPAIWNGLEQTIISEAIGEATDINAAGYVVGWTKIAAEAPPHGFVWHPEHGLQDLGPGEAFNIDEVGNVAGCRDGSWGAAEARATVWQVEMTSAEYLVGFESLTRRLLAETDDKASRAVFRQIDLAQKSLERSHVSAARRHLDRALAAISKLEQSGQLTETWAQSLLKIGHWVGERLQKAIKIVEGWIDLHPGIRSVSLRGTRGFTLEARAGTGREPGDACAYVPCVPASTVQLVAGWSGIDLPGTATFRGQTFTNVGGLTSRTSAGIVLSGTWVAPPQAVTASIDLPVTLSGLFIWPDGREPLEGTGFAELTLQWLDAQPAGWRVTGASFEFGGRQKH
jgi:probable HAF family extracellular repeat protein